MNQVHRNDPLSGWWWYGSPAEGWVVEGMGPSEGFQFLGIRD